MRVAIITGASSGLGKAYAQQLDRLGGLDELWLIARREDRLESDPEREVRLRYEGLERLLI